MKFSTLIEVVSAVHLSPLVASGEVGEERGGIIFTAPPGHLKTSAIEYLDQFPKTKMISNITVGKLNDLRESFIAGEIKTIAFPDYDMIYKRHSSVSSQIEGIVMSLTGEGYRQGGFFDQRVNVLKSRVTVVAGITLKCYESRISEWIDSGFARRFLFSRFRVVNPEKMEAALAKWKRAQLDGDFIMKVPHVGKQIPYVLKESQANKILWELRFQHDRKIPFILAQRIISVLAWKHPKQYMAIWKDFSPSLGKDGAEVVI